MEFALVLSLSFLAAVANGNQAMVKLDADQPFLRVALSQTALIKCCYSCKENLHVTWVMNTHIDNGTTMQRYMNLSDEVKTEPMTEVEGLKCHGLILKNVRVDDTALYQCFINLTSPPISIYTHGTFLQVYIPMQKTINLSESVKNSIITAEGVLLLLCVLIPGTMLLCKSKRLNELERKKDREEENIYEGLNLDDCNSIYHQIQRSHVQGPYQDVACGEIQLEKP
ncbi:B-cell antigen receptor complex-associated protein alpha chain [Triplophysa dalaica]|uniref:B-cell antigen receptor complex-associated protein alpha chain n=1 Tax=Triplophysa dalaica TaxID=1582913 RepID=UPI0024DF34C1|nr:B-cell antigen receptor complex-associated protein alpha chain [Triplophysa dalaica]